MTRRLARKLYYASPASVVRSVRRRAARRPAAAVPADDSYAETIVALFHEYLVETYPEQALPLAEFAGLVRRYHGSGRIGEYNVFIGDLWRLFAPDYRQRLPEYYRAFELPNVMRMLEYARDRRHLQEYFVTPYELARAELGRFSVLEVGAGVPHGFLYEQLRKPGFVSKLTVNDIDATYTRFVEWFCRREGIPFELVPAVAGEPATLPEGGSHDFVFAKDVFEHVVDPRRLLEQIVRVASPRAILALDLEDKGARIHQHVSPRLMPLRADVEAAGFRELARSGNVTLFSRGQP